MAEIISCPSCQRKVQVPETYLGKLVQCPECKHQFTAVSASSGVQSAPPPVPAPPPPAPAWEQPRPAADDEEIDRPRRRRESRYDADDEDDDYDDFVPSRSRRRSLAPHRGGMILAFGIMSFVVCIVFGIMAWVMGNNDLREIRAGRMDPSGEGMTQAGRILGMIHVILFLVIVVAYCVIVAIMIATDGGGGPRRF